MPRPLATVLNDRRLRNRTAGDIVGRPAGNFQPDCLRAYRFGGTAAGAGLNIHTTFPEGST